MARTKFGSPKIEFDVTEDQVERAIASKSGGCLIADGIKQFYPQFSKITVDMATIRVSDRKAGYRYTYLTPAHAQHMLLSLDQGWPGANGHVKLGRAVQVTPLKRPAARGVSNAKKLVEFEAKIANGEELTSDEKRVFSRLKKAPKRPTSEGPKEAKVNADGSAVVSGKAAPQGKDHPNLLRGYDRHFGAKLADPGTAFQEAVDAAVAQREAEANGIDTSNSSDEDAQIPF